MSRDKLPDENELFFKMIIEVMRECNNACLTDRAKSKRIRWRELGRAVLWAGDKIDDIESLNAVLEAYAERMTTLAIKWVDAGHQDWIEIKKMIRELDAAKI